jgi:hypothetical protein
MFDEVAFMVTVVLAAVVFAPVSVAATDLVVAAVVVFVLVAVSLHHVPPLKEQFSVGTFVLHKSGLLDQTQPTHPDKHVASSLRFLRRCLPVHLECICTLQDTVRCSRATFYNNPAHIVHKVQRHDHRNCRTVTHGPEPNSQGLKSNTQCESSTMVH